MKGGGGGRCFASVEMLMESPVRYAKSGDVHIAYRIFGSGPRDIVLVPGTVSHVELFWEFPVNQYLLKRLGSFARVIVFDKRGQGLSDRVADLTLEERMGDVKAVMNAAGSKRATIYGWSEGGQMSMVFAATHPERTSGLVLYGTYASLGTDPYTFTRDQFERWLSHMEKHWGEGILISTNAPSRAKDEAFVQWMARVERAVASPGSIAALLRANYEIDIRHLLSSIHVPTLILHRKGDSVAPVEAGRYLAEHIPKAKYLELPGNDHLLQAIDQDVLDLLLDEIELFTTGVLHRPRPDQILAAAMSDAGPKEPYLSRSESGPVADTIAELERCRDMIATCEDPRELAGLIARAEALVAAARGSWQESEAQFIKAVDTFRRHKMAWQEEQTLKTWGRTLQAGSDRRGLIEKLDSAIEVYKLERAEERRVHAADDGSARTSRGRETREARGSAVQPNASDGRLFRREGDYWTVSWDGNLVRLKDAKGFRYLAYLLANPGQLVLARELATLGLATGNRQASNDSGLTAANLSDAGAIIDARARKQYQQRLRDLREELAEAERLNDTGRATGLRAELESVSDQLGAAVGLGGRVRKAASHNERARLMVTKAIKAAIARISASNDALGHHLAISIRTGNYCTYDPGPNHRTWQL